MTNSPSIKRASPSADKADIAYSNIVKKMKNQYSNDISETEAHEAARNLIGFCQTLLAMQRQSRQTSAL